MKTPKRGKWLQGTLFNPRAQKKNNHYKTTTKNLLGYSFVYLTIIVLRPKTFEFPNIDLPFWKIPFFHSVLCLQVDLSIDRNMKGTTKGSSILLESTKIISTTILFLILLAFHHIEINTALSIKVLTNTFLISMFALIASIPFESFKRNIPKSQNSLTDNLSEYIEIRGLNQKDKYKIRVSRFLYLKSEGHYIKLFVLKDHDNETETLVIRNSLVNIEEQTKIYENLQRVHKSYMINTEYIHLILGNAHGGSLVLLGQNGPKVPFSRTYYTLIKKLNANV